MERKVGGGIGMGNTCKPLAVSFQCMTKSTTNKKKIAGWLLHSVVFVCAVHLCESVRSIHIFPPSCASLHPSCPVNPSETSQGPVACGAGRPAWGLSFEGVRCVLENTP